MLFLLLLLLVGACVSADVSADHYVLATRWPQTVCEMYHGPCNIPANVSAFTVHGLWPDNYAGKDPAYCSGAGLNMTQLQPILPSLLQLWPNFYADSTSESFWKHEWDKHGKCAVDTGDFPDEESYFSAALSKVIRYNGFQILASFGIGPSQEPQKLNTILQALNETLYYRFILSCQHQSDPDRFLLSQLEVCFDKSMDPIDCYIDDDHSYYHVNGCSKHADVYYLPLQH
ncbi:ribonuclease Oy-like [Pollicipes pollicipes]|uniref:ribonuclease Oy-like n=1 Tax=Pollicipes pollicipes TaxID=41117 RepID=UPI0018851B0C|nr:ribonuclease Oy-like [Pollicipes pollicipes]